MILIFDSETTGFLVKGADLYHPDHPHLVDIACSLFDDTGIEVERYDEIINPGVEIPTGASDVHGITTAVAREYGVDPREAMVNFEAMYDQCNLVVGHNVEYDLAIMGILSRRLGGRWCGTRRSFCTMRQTENLCKIPSKYPYSPYKFPSLDEAIFHFFQERRAVSHRARLDADDAARLFFHLKEQGLA